jgi:hypothetical protein
MGDLSSVPIRPISPICPVRGFLRSCEFALVGRAKRNKEVPIMKRLFSFFTLIALGFTSGCAADFHERETEVNTGQVVLDVIVLAVDIAAHVRHCHH